MIHRLRPRKRKTQKSAVDELVDDGTILSDVPAVRNGYPGRVQLEPWIDAANDSRRVERGTMPLANPWLARRFHDCAQVVEQPKVIVESAVAHRFNAYATCALPREIGGLLRVEHDGGAYRISDLKLFTHQKASCGYFELDGNAVADFLLGLVREGRRNEVGEWCGIVHSHPNMAPLMSGTDVANVVQLAGDGLAFSLICEAHRDPGRNAYALHAALGGRFPLVLSSLDFSSNGTLAGHGSLSADDLAEIELEVRELMKGASWATGKKASAFFAARPPLVEDRELEPGSSLYGRAISVTTADEEMAEEIEPDDQADDQAEWAFEQSTRGAWGSLLLTDEEYVLCDEAISHFQDRAESLDEEELVESLDELRPLLDLELNAASDPVEFDLLRDALTSYAASPEAPRDRTDQAILERLIERLG